MKKRIVSLLICLVLLGGICAIPAGAAFQVTYYNEEVYAGGILDLYAFVGDADLSGYTFQWQFEGLEDSWINLDDNANYKGTKTNHLQVYTKSDTDYTHWEEIPFQCKVTKDGFTQYTPELHMYIRPYSAMLEGLKKWEIGLFEPSLTNVSGLSTKDDINYTASAYAGSNIEIFCGGSTESQQSILVKSEVQLKREIKISENNKYIVTGDRTSYVPYTIGTNAVKIEINMRIIMAGVDKGIYQTKTINLTTKKPEAIARGVTTKECSMLRSPYNESQTLGSLPQGAVVEVVGKTGGYYQVYVRNVISYIPEGLLRVDTPVSDAVIKDVELTIPAPVAGESPSYTCQFQSPGCELYKTDPITWTDKTTGKFLQPGEKFIEGRSYSLSIWVAAKQGYRFQLDASGKPKLTGAINGNLPPFIYVAYEQDPEKVIELVYTFAPTPKAPEHTHTLSDWRTTQVYHYTVCTTCGDMLEQEDHKGGKATCVEKGKCTFCGYTYLPETEVHVPESKWTACAELYHAHLCKLCGAHCDPEDHKPGPEATETTPQQCTVCDYIITPAKNHKHQLTQVETTDPTCTKEGIKTHYTCDGCNELFADKDGKEKLKDISLPALGHGLKDGKCTRCDYVARGEETTVPESTQEATEEATEPAMEPEQTTGAAEPETEPTKPHAFGAAEPPDNRWVLWVFLGLLAVAVAVPVVVVVVIVNKKKKKV